MTKLLPLLAAVALPFALCAGAAETVLTARAADYQPTSRFGRIEIRAEIEGTVDFTIDGTSVVAEVYTGSQFTGAAATYTEPLPHAMYRGIKVISIGAAKVKLLEEPNRLNGYKARVRVSNKQRHLANVRVLWELDTRFNGTRLPTTPSEHDNALIGRMELVGRFANEVEFKVRGTEVQADGPFVLQTLHFTQPIPEQLLTKFSKRGDVEIVEPPGTGNRHTATIRVRSVKPEGEDRKIELEWKR